MHQQGKGNEKNTRVTAVGKRCHDRGCAIRRLAGTCIMPREGVFARVVEGGIVGAGDTLSVP